MQENLAEFKNITNTITEILKIAEKTTRIAEKLDEIVDPNIPKDIYGKIEIQFENEKTIIIPNITPSGIETKEAKVNKIRLTVSGGYIQIEPIKEIINEFGAENVEIAENFMLGRTTISRNLTFLVFCKLNQKLMDEILEKAKRQIEAHEKQIKELIDLLMTIKGMIVLARSK